jgi:hypothetical protein
MPANPENQGRHVESAEEITVPARRRTRLPEPEDPVEKEKLERRRTQWRVNQRRWWEKNPHLHRQKIARWQRSERGREYRAEWRRESLKREPSEATSIRRQKRKEYMTAYMREWRKRKRN